ncbi:hypothetical protein F2Q68_00030052 [Brassica cretica]|uniref:RRM domain-containing protein n=1 Tax=Brassica cretica TaxID=69181 RepID=A0A8S9GB48_BRACR|nr:hypothetical protein F2Q68_00030052 [Brassica cretica]
MLRSLTQLFIETHPGLAYVDFGHDEHLAAAIAKNRKMLLGKKISIARSNPKKEGSGNSKDASQVSDKAKASLGGETKGEKRGSKAVRS